MKIRFDPKKIRIRISQKELFDLEKYSEIREEFEFPNGIILPFIIRSKSQNQDIAFKYSNNQYVFAISQQVIDFLKENPKSKNGHTTQYLKKNQEESLLSIAVDLI